MPTSGPPKEAWRNCPGVVRQKVCEMCRCGGQWILPVESCISLLRLAIPFPATAKPLSANDAR